VPSEARSHRFQGTRRAEDDASGLVAPPRFLSFRAALSDPDTGVCGSNGSILGVCGIDTERPRLPGSKGMVRIEEARTGVRSLAVANLLVADRRTCAVGGSRILAHHQTTRRGTKGEVWEDRRPIRRMRIPVVRL
jgi:hypothetical protein